MSSEAIRDAPADIRPPSDEDGKRPARGPVRVPRGSVRVPRGPVRAVQAAVADVTLHEMLKRELAAEAGADIPYGAAAITSDVARAEDADGPAALPTETGVEDVYVLLDSRFKEESASDPGRGRYRFNLNPEGSGGGDGISITGSIRGAIEIAVDPFVIPVPLTISRGFQAHDDATSALSIVSDFYNVTSVVVEAAKQVGQRIAKAFASQMKSLKHGLPMATAMMALTFQPITVVQNAQLALRFG